MSRIITIRIIHYHRVTFIWYFILQLCSRSACPDDKTPPDYLHPPFQWLTTSPTNVAILKFDQNHPLQDQRLHSMRARYATSRLVNDRADFFFPELKAIPSLCYKGMPPLARHAQTTYAAWPQDLRKGGSWGISRVVVLVSPAVTGGFTQEQPGKSNIENKSSSAAHTERPLWTKRQQNQRFVVRKSSSLWQMLWGVDRDWGWV